MNCDGDWMVIERIDDFGSRDESESYYYARVDQCGD